MLRSFFTISLTIIAAAAFGEALAQTPSRGTANPLIREEQKIEVNGDPEIWRLQWKSVPEDAACGTQDLLGATTCPCGSFAYAENGQLDLVRIKNGQEIDRLELTPLFERVFADQKGAILQRWPFALKDIDDRDTAGFSERVRRRAIVKIMNFADYDHDGKSSEFFLQTGVAPCAKALGIVVGVTPQSPRLHAFSSASRPDKPLVLQKTEWEALRKSAGPIEVLDWACGDHASERELDMGLRAVNGVIQVIQRQYECTDEGRRGRLLSEENR